MYLKSLDMLGFKSFHEARIEFPDGVTAIVGPNGSGKSNVVDAILWVLGEQSTKTLRSEKMEDVIFNGTEARKPLGMAEVSLIISGLDRINVDPLSGLSSQLAEFQELMITRRLYRNGDSEYLINKTPCRLKDIRSVLLDTRAGTKGHTVIAQGQIDQILNASPQDRRELIEETAGIIRYKKQKAEALRKLESTQQNLLRVRDIIAEVKKQLNSLERQARQARSYQTLQQEAKSLEIQLLTHEYRTLRSIIQAVEAELQTFAQRESGEAAEQARLAVALEQVRLAVFGANDAIAHIREELASVEQQQAQALTAAEVERNRSGLFEEQRIQERQELDRLTEEQRCLMSEIATVEETLATLERESAGREQAVAALDRDLKALLHQRAATLAEEERGRVDVLNLAVLVANTEQSLIQLAARMQDAAERDGRLVRERGEVETQQTVARDKQEQLQAACRGAEQLVETLRQRHQQVLEQGDQSAEELAAVDQQLQRQSEELAATDSHLRALRGVLQEDMGYGRCGEEEATALKTCPGVHDAVAEWLTIPAGFDRAVEAILGERVRGWFVDGPAAATQAIDFLKSKDLGRGTFIPQQPRWTSRTPPSDTWWATISGQSGVVGRAVDLIQVEPHREGTRNYLFDRVVFVDSLQAATRLWEQQAWSAPDGPVLVTRSGEILDPAGVMTGGQVSTTGGLLQRRREALELDAQRERLVAAVEDGRQRRDHLLAQGLSLKEEVRQLAEALREAEMRALSLQKDVAGIGQVLGDLTQRAGTLASDATQHSREVLQLEQEMRSSEAQLTQWISEKIGQETGLGQVRARLSQIDQQVQMLQQQVTEAQLIAQGVRTTREHRQGDLLRLQQVQFEASSRAESLTRHLESLVASLEQSQADRQRQETLCQGLGQSAAQIKAQLVEAQEQQAQDMATARQHESGLEEVRQRLASIREGRMLVEVRRAEVRTQLGTVESTLLGTYQVDLSNLAEGLSSISSDAPMNADAEPTTQGGSIVTEQALREQLQKVRDRLDRMGPINLAAISEHQQLEERFRFLSAQEQDLATSIGSLKEIIHRINRTTKEMFVDTFAELQQKFGEVFAKFFPGGRAELQLVEVPPDETEEGRGPQEPGVDIVAQPPGKRLKSITMLSGGEKTLTAMALLFASFLIRPTPFCILDEIDAPLDEENIGRFTGVLRELARDAQFMVITHNKRTMGIADSLFGVTMEEPGISKLVSVRLTDLQPA
jgi:chromosome segregation protein